MYYVHLFKSNPISFDERAVFFSSPFSFCLLLFVDIIQTMRKQPVYIISWALSKMRCVCIPHQANEQNKKKSSRKNSQSVKETCSNSIILSHAAHKISIYLIQSCYLYEPYRECFSKHFRVKMGCCAKSLEIFLHYVYVQHLLSFSNYYGAIYANKRIEHIFGLRYLSCVSLPFPLPLCVSFLDRSLFARIFVLLAHWNNLVYDVLQHVYV